MTTLTGGAGELAAALLANAGGAPPRLFRDGFKPSGLGTSALRAFGKPPEPAEDQLFCPGAVRDDPALGDLVDDELLVWAEQVGIYPGRLGKLRSYGFGRFLMLAHPAATDPDRLLAAAKCLVAEWAADDYYVDEVSLGADPAVVGSRLANLMSVIDPVRTVPRYAADLDAHHRVRPISRAFRTAVEHLSRYASPAQIGRFQHQVTLLFLASAQEADWRVNRRTPPVWEYLVQRQSNSYLPPMLLIDVLAGYELPAQEYYHPRVRQAFTTAGNAAVLVNDIYSAGRESDDDFNLPAVLTANEGLTTRQALLRTVEIHNELMHTFVEQAAPLAATGSPALRRFLADTWAWLGGSRHWHATTARYRNRS
jgi:2-methylisoborneol synthase